MNNLQVQIKHYSKKELAQAYGISVRTLRKEILQLKILTVKDYNSKRIFTPNEVRKIFERIGEP